MTSLPSSLPPQHRDNPVAKSAYDKCLAAEQHVLTLPATDRSLVYVRILGHLFHIVPDITKLVEDISSAKDQCALFALGQLLYDHFIRGFRLNNERTPAPSSHPSRRSFDDVFDLPKSELVASAPSHKTAKKKALIRDDFRCLLTGFYDIKALQIPDLRAKLDADPKLCSVPTECAHIFPESINANVDSISSPSEPSFSATMSTVISRFGYMYLPSELNGSLIHRLENVLTLSGGIHTLFHQLSIWFEPTETPHIYRVQGIDPIILRGYPREVIFTTSDPRTLPLPSPTYLAIHAACARVAHLSGASRCIDEFDRDREEQTVLDPNGGSAMWLEDALRGLQVFGHARE